MAERKSLVLQRSLSSTEGFSFNRSDRFSKDNQSPGFYNISRGLNKRGTIFGSEKRPEFIKTTITPGPCNYSPLPSKVPAGKISPSNLGARLLKGKNSSPGPGSYIINRDLEGPKYSFQKKYKRKEPQATPSAANYNPNFSYVADKTYSGISFGYGNKVDPSKGKKVPGPGSYSLPIFFPKIKKEITQFPLKEKKSTK
jgi:hypothetical protein